MRAAKRSNLFCFRYFVIDIRFYSRQEINISCFLEEITLEFDRKIGFFFAATSGQWN